MHDDGSKEVVAVGPHGLEGFLRVPQAASGLVIFAHGAGSSHLSTRNNEVAEALGRRGIATLLFDLLTESEAADRTNVFDISLLSRRMIEAMEWVRSHPNLGALPVGLFGSSTGAAAALLAAAEAPQRVAAVVSRGGRADMAGAALPKVAAPVLLIVGGADHQVLELNRGAKARLTCPHRLEIVPGATHLFEEPGALEQVVELAGDWFARQFTEAQGES
ncbi:dienelactone hydrolase family protein [Roseovarius salinarum]|uniref:dienelactone hydrolase family protein n=1 Tax=Roseovarius salinarum TaxID=1981892 RepID=UPI001E56D39D|nr:alpha/beta fold hydrolase [Roseovarius salinarum]